MKHAVIGTVAVFLAFGWSGLATIGLLAMRARRITPAAAVIAFTACAIVSAGLIIAAEHV